LTNKRSKTSQTSSISAEAQAEKLLNASASAILEVNSNGHILYASQPIFNLFGYLPEELIGQSIEFLMPERKRAGHHVYFERFLQQAENRSMGMGSSFPGLHKKGHEVNISIGLTLLESDNANDLTVVVTITEANTLQQVEESLKDSQKQASLSQAENQRLLAMVHNSKNITMLVEPDLTISWVNSALTKMLGYTAQYVIGKHPLFCIADKTPSKEQLLLNQSFERHLVYSGKFQFIKDDGALLWVDVNVYPSYVDETFLGFVVHINDVDAHQKLIEEALRQKENLESTARIARLGTWELDINDNALHWSDEVYAIHEIEPGTKIDVANAINYYAPEARPIVTKAIQDSIESGGKWDLELPFITAKNNRIWVRAVGYVEYQDGVPVRLKGAFQDITDLKNAVAASEAANKAKSLFLANMSHEIRTPINGVLGMNDLLLASGLNHKQTEYANIVKQSAESLLYLINELLDFNKLEAGKLELFARDFDLREKVTERAQWHVHAATKKGLDFTLDFASDLPVLIHADDYRLAQIINNLCTNAVKFTHQGSIHLTFSLQGASTLLVKIVDTGIGISNENLRNVFAEFEQVDSSITRAYGGTGLGLSICRQLVSLMNGELGVESQEGKGSTFWFTLPFEAAEQTKTINKQQYLAPSIIISCQEDVINQWQNLKVNNALDVKVVNSMSKALAELKLSQRWLNIIIMPDVSESTDISLFAKSVMRLGMMKVKIFWPNTDSESQLEANVHSYATEVMFLDDPVVLAKNLGTLLNVVLSHQAGQKSERLTALENKRLLIAEDNQINQVVFTEMLSYLNIELDIAGDGAEAIRLIEQNGAYDFVIMDCQMPIMDGFEATKLIRSSDKPNIAQQRIIAATAHGMAEDLEACLKIGMDDYLVKPFTQEQLISALIRNL
jgi:PAS domain S-box-containing protein